MNDKQKIIEKLISILSLGGRSEIEKDTFLKKAKSLITTYNISRKELLGKVEKHILDEIYGVEQDANKNTNKKENSSYTDFKNKYYDEYYDKKYQKYESHTEQKYDYNTKSHTEKNTDSSTKKINDLWESMRTSIEKDGSNFFYSINKFLFWAGIDFSSHIKDMSWEKLPDNIKLKFEEFIKRRNFTNSIKTKWDSDIYYVDLIKRDIAYDLSTRYEILVSLGINWKYAIFDYDELPTEIKLKLQQHV